MWIIKKKQYGEDVIMFLHNKIIKKKKLNYLQKNVGLLNNPWFYSIWFRKTMHMVLKPCARPPKKIHGFIVYGLGGPCK